MNALLGMDRYCKEVIQVSTWRYDIKVPYLYDKRIEKEIPIFLFKKEKQSMTLNGNKQL